MANKSDFDVDFRDGYAAEMSVAKLLSIDTVEVKRQTRAIEVGCIFIETHCWSVYEQRWVKSGINTSKATHWAFVLENDYILLLGRRQLIKACTNYGYRWKMPKKPHPAWGISIKLADLIKGTQYDDRSND